MIRTARPLTAREKVQLDNWNRTLDARSGRVYAVAGGLGVLGGAGLSWWLTAPALAAGGRSTLTESLPVLTGVEAALGPLWTSVLLGGMLFGGGMLGVAWRLVRAMRAQRNALRARYLVAGAEGEAGQ